MWNILKFRLEIGDCALELPQGAWPMSVVVDEGVPYLYVWAWRDPAEMIVKTHICVRPTGADTEGCDRFVASFTLPPIDFGDTPFVGHVFTAAPRFTSTAGIAPSEPPPVAPGPAHATTLRQRANYWLERGAVMGIEVKAEHLQLTMGIDARSARTLLEGK